jgi:hypothetical protein
MRLWDSSIPLICPYLHTIQNHRLQIRLKNIKKTAFKTRQFHVTVTLTGLGRGNPPRLISRLWV